MHKIIYVEVGGFKLPLYNVKKRLNRYWSGKLKNNKKLQHDHNKLT